MVIYVVKPLFLFPTHIPGPGPLSIVTRSDV